MRSTVEACCADPWINADVVTVQKAGECLGGCVTLNRKQMYTLPIGTASRYQTSVEAIGILSDLSITSLQLKNLFAGMSSRGTPPAVMIMAYEEFPDRYLTDDNLAVDDFAEKHLWPRCLSLARSSSSDAYHIPSWGEMNSEQKLFWVHLRSHKDLSKLGSECYYENYAFAVRAGVMQVMQRTDGGATAVLLGAGVIPNCEYGGLLVIVSQFWMAFVTKAPLFIGEVDLTLDNSVAPVKDAQHDGPGVGQSDEREKHKYNTHIVVCLSL